MIKNYQNKLIEDILQIPIEDRSIEFKRMGKEFNLIKAIESIVAMANTDGGRLIIGVDDPEKTELKGVDRVLGIEENLEVYDELGREIQRISPPISDLWPPLLLKCINGKTIALINIPKAQDNFHSINDRVFIRLEKGNKRLTPHEIIKLSYAKGFSCADRELVDIDFDLLNTQYYEQWKLARGIIIQDIQVVLFNTGLARKDEQGILKPTRAAVLLFALFPSNITLYNIGYVRAEGYRNDLLVKHLREFPQPPNLDQNEGVRAMRIEMNRQNLYPPIYLTYPFLQVSVRIVLLNAIRASEWDKVYSYLAKEEKYITNEIVRTIIDNPDTSKVSKILSKWVHQGLLIRIETGAKKTIKYRLPVDRTEIK